MGEGWGRVLIVGLGEGFYNRGVLFFILGLCNFFLFSFFRIFSKFWIYLCGLFWWNLGGIEIKDLVCFSFGLIRGREERRIKWEEIGVKLIFF